LDQLFYRDEHLFLDLHQQLVMLDGETVALMRREYRLLALLAGKVVPRSNLLMHIWGHVREVRPSTLDVHIRGLRRKLGVYAHQYVETVVGTGYRFQPLLGRRC
jgi:two-component system phosphate regulon response regulator PhoB